MNIEKHLGLNTVPMVEQVLLTAIIIQIYLLHLSVTFMEILVKSSYIWYI